MHYYCYRTLTPSTECHRNLVVCIEPTKVGCYSIVPRNLKTFRLSSTAIVLPTLKNLVKIGPVYVEKIGLAEIVKRQNLKNKKHQRNAWPAGLNK